MKLNEYEKLMAESCDRLAAAQDENKRLRDVMRAIDHTLSVHGHMDAHTLLHDRLQRTLAMSPSHSETP